MDANGSPSIIVQKFGGSSVADVERIGKVADRIVATKRAGHHVVVVVSAMGKTTDGLVALANNVNGQRGEVPRRELDMLVSTGERVSMSLLSIAIQARGIKAISFTGSQSGILTNDRHFDARIIEVRPHRIEDELSRGNVVIVAGYQGMSYKREITTLGRGGSDTTAVALAAALRAERCEIYSDVDGVYSADPRVVADAKHLPELDLETLQEMSEAGAKVLCAQAIEWAQKRGITLIARSTFDSGRESVISPPQAGLQKARAVSHETKLCRLRFSGIQHGDVLAALKELELPFKDLSFCGDSGTLLIPLLNVPSHGPRLDKLEAILSGAELLRDVATVSVVGDGLTTSAEPLVAALDELREAGVETLGFVATPLRLTIVVAPQAVDEAVRALHARFVAY